MRLYPRENYLKKIRSFYHDTDLIKVITDIRRCGKSCLMQTIADEIKSSDIPDENIIYMNLDTHYYEVDFLTSCKSKIAAFEIKSSGTGKHELKM